MMDKKQILENEQWKRGGDCNKCRRQKYCGTRCKPYKDNIDVTIHNLAYHVLNQATGGAYGQIMEKASDANIRSMEARTYNRKQKKKG